MIKKKKDTPYGMSFKYENSVQSARFSALGI